jgi:fucose 4-O-acetylase-like acetyltransferase
MAITVPQTERIHSLDNLRAMMMLLGVVLHSAITYSNTALDNVWPLKDPISRDISFDYLVKFIHSFRMPVFFMVSGFFAALLFYEKSPTKMIRNRLKRIVYPFLVFLFLLWPFILISWIYTSMAISGTQNAFSVVFDKLANPLFYFPKRTFHLWFLYYLIYITFFSWALALAMKSLPKLSQRIKSLFALSMRYQLAGLFIFAILTFLLFYLFNLTWTTTTVSFIPHGKSLVLYSVYYFWGWLLFKSNKILTQLVGFATLFTGIGILLFLFQNLFKNSISNLHLMLINAVMVWAFNFGITGLFVRYMDSHNVGMRYLSDSAYWVYLVHFPLTVLIPGLLVDFHLPALIKFLIVLSVTLFFCLLSYHFFVRGSFIGQFINGKKISSKAKKIDKPIAELA